MNLLQCNLPNLQNLLPTGYYCKWRNSFCTYYIVMNHNSRDKEDVGENHEVIHLFLNDNGAVLVRCITKPKQAWNWFDPFQKVATELFLKNLFTDSLPAQWCLQTSVTQQWLRLWAWFFHCSMSLQPERCLLSYRSIYKKKHHSGYFNCRGYFQTVVYSYCYITGWPQLATKRNNSYFTFQTIIDILGCAMS